MNDQNRTLSTAAIRARQRFVTARNNPREITDHDKGTLALIESKVLDLATIIEGWVEDGRLKSIALTHLEETLTWANKSIYIEGAVDGELVFPEAFLPKDDGHTIALSEPSDPPSEFGPLPGGAPAFGVVPRFRHKRIDTIIHIKGQARADKDSALLDAYRYETSDGLTGGMIQGIDLAQNYDRIDAEGNVI